MALRKIKLGWYAYYTDEDGHQRTISLHTRDEALARELHRQLMRDITVAKLNAALLERHGAMFPADMQNRLSSTVASIPESRHRQRGLRLDAMIETAKQHRELSPRHIATFQNFCAAVAPKRYAHEITPQIALDYLDRTYPTDEGNGKGYNNALTHLNVIFKACLVKADMTASPFAVLPRRVVRDIEHYRPFTPEEFRTIFAAAVDPWKTAALISWHAALRRETCFRLAWSHIDEFGEPPSITIMPGKTARFGRAVWIPIHPELLEHLRSLPRPADSKKPILSQWARHIHVKGCKDKDYFAGLLISLGIGATREGKVGFHSLRASFVTCCDEAGIARRATRGVAGHTTDDMTDLYSHDRETAKQILTLPSVLK